MDAELIRAKYYKYVPAVIIPNKVEISKTRFLLPESENFGLCIAGIRKHIKTKAGESVIFLIDNRTVDMQQNVGAFYSQYKLNKKPKDSFLIINILKENTFG